MDDQNLPEGGRPDFEKLEQQIADLTQRVARLEQQARESAGAAPVPPGPVRIPPPPVFQQAKPPVIPVPPARHEVPTAPPRPPAPGVDWESLIGGKWALWVGSVAVLLTVAWFLQAYAWDLLGPSGRCTLGVVAGVALLAFGTLRRPSETRWFSQGLSGAGLGVLFITIWAASATYHFIPFTAAFVCAAAVTAAGAALAVRQDALSLILLCTIGGFLTPVVLGSGGASGGAGQAIPFLSYILLLDCGMLGVSLFKRWRPEIFLCFVLTTLLVTAWASGSLTPVQRWQVFAFATLYFLLFFGAASFYSLMRREQTAPEDLLLLFTSASVYWVAGMVLIAEVPAPCLGAFTLGLSVFYAGMAALTASQAPENQVLKGTLVGLAVVFLTIAVPVQLRQKSIAVAWCAEAAALVTLGAWTGSMVVARFGQALGALALCAVAGSVMFLFPERHLLFLNETALPLLVFVLGSCWSAWAAQPPRAKRADEIAHMYGFFGVAGGAWLIAQETFLGADWFLPSGVNDANARAACLAVTLTAVWAVAMLWGGIRLKIASFRGARWRCFWCLPSLPCLMSGSITPRAGHPSSTCGACSI